MTQTSGYAPVYGEGQPLILPGATHYNIFASQALLDVVLPFLNSPA